MEHHLNKNCGSMEFKQQVPTSSMEFHGILSWSKISWNSMGLFPYSRVPWNSMELLIFPKNNSMEFHGTWSIWYSKNYISKYFFLGSWFMIICYLAKISQKRHIMQLFQYRSSYFVHSNVSEYGTRSAKVACYCTIEGTTKRIDVCANWHHDQQVLT